MNERDGRFDDVRRENGEPERTTAERTETSDGGTREETRHYYAYGPYRSVDAAQDATDSGRLSHRESSDEVPADMVRPAPIPDPYAVQPAAQRHEWHYPGRKRSRFRSMFASFLAGAIVVTGLMFAADTANLFTGDNAAAVGADDAGGSNTAGGAGNDSKSGSAQNAALQDIVRPNNIAEIVKKASPAVVMIETYVNSNRRNSSLFDDPFFRFFFGDDYLPNYRQNDGQKVQSGMGSGFIFDKDGYILTNQHVIANADEILVRVEGYTEPFKATLLGANYDLDLAALKIEGEEDFPTLAIGESDELEVGDWVVAIGNPYGFEHTVTVGVLSAKERPITIPDTQGPRQYKHLLQTDASINPGNSGGPLLNLKGEVIGINTAVSSQAQGIGFAIPTSTVVSVLDNLKNDLPIPKPYLGIYMQDLTREQLKRLKLDSGVVITAIEEGSAADKAGLQVFDVIVEFDGKKVESSQHLQSLVSDKKVGDKVELNIQRAGEMQTITVTLGDRSQQNQQ